MIFVGHGKWRHSLILQIIALVFVFLILTITYFVVLPNMVYEKYGNSVSDTRNLVKMEIVSGHYENIENFIDSLASSEILKEVAERNSRFRYFVKEGERVAQYGEAPRWNSTVLSQEFESSDASKGYDEVECDLAEHLGGRFETGEGVAFVHYHGCGSEEFYAEWAGINVPIERHEKSGLWTSITIYGTSRLKLIFVTLGFFIIAILLLLLTTRSIQRLSQTVESFDINDLDCELPEKGLPTEILPLVRAVNLMNKKIVQTYDQQEFFLAAAAHEVRTPMAILRTNLEDLPDGEAKERLRRDARRMSSLVEQLLQLMEIRGMDNRSDQVDLVAVAKRVVAERAPLSLKQGIEIELETAPKAQVISGDQRLLHVALANLIDNAISFSSSGDVVSIAITHSKRITVRDRGPGISADCAETLFEPFTKYPPNRKGHGLGLAIVKAIMNLHGGEISVKNAATGSGTQFTLQF